MFLGQYRLTHAKNFCGFHERSEAPMKYAFRIVEKASNIFCFTAFFIGWIVFFFSFIPFCLSKKGFKSSHHHLFSVYFWREINMFRVYCVAIFMDKDLNSINANLFNVQYISVKCNLIKIYSWHDFTNQDQK